MLWRLNPDSDEWELIGPPVSDAGASGLPSRLEYLITGAGRLRVVRQSAGLEANAQILRTADGVECDFPHPRGFDCEALPVTVSYEADRTRVDLREFASLLPKGVDEVEVRFDTVTVVFSRLKQWQEEVIGLPHSPTAGIGEIDLPIHWRWLPEIVSWQTKTFGALAGITSTPSPASLVAISISGTLPSGAALLLNSKKYSLGASAGCHELIAENDTALTWGDFLQELMESRKLEALADEHLPAVLDIGGLLSLPRPERYFLRLKQTRTAFTPKPSTSNPEPAMFGPPEPMAPGVQATGLITLDSAGKRPSSTAPMLPSTLSRTLPPLLLRKREDAYGVLAIAPDNGQVTWVPAHVLTGSGIVSWCGLIDQFSIVEIMIDGAPTYALLFDTGFALDDSFAWAAPFGGVGTVQSRNRWAHVDQAASKLVLHDNRWIASKYSEIDTSRWVGQSFADVRYQELPLTIALRPHAAASGPILTVAPGSSVPRLKGMLASAHSTLQTITGAEIPIGLSGQVKDRYEITSPDEIENLPSILKDAARSAFANDTDAEKTEEAGIHWVKTGRTISFTFTATEASGVFTGVMTPSVRNEG